MNTESLKKVIHGEVLSDDATREKYSHDASLFEVVPEVVVFPKDAGEVQSLVRYVAEHKKVTQHCLLLRALQGHVCQEDVSTKVSF